MKTKCPDLIESYPFPVQDKPLTYNLSAAAELGPEERLCMALLKPEDKIFETNNIADLTKYARLAFGGLAANARNGNGKALTCFIQLAIEVGEAISEMTHQSPAAVHPVAKYCSRWPMMRSTHPLNCDCDEVLTKIGLGEAVPLQIDKHSKWKPDWAATYAVRLFEHIQIIRSENPKVNGKNFTKVLPPFTKESAHTWWNLAERFLLASYPKPQDVPELSGIITDLNKRKTPGRLKQAIRDKIKSRFLAIPKQLI